MSEASIQAADWYARLLAPDCSKEDLERFHCWLDESIEHNRAFAAVEAFCANMALDPRLKTMAENINVCGTAVTEIHAMNGATGAGKSQHINAAKGYIFGLAASLLIAIGVAFHLNLFNPTPGSADWITTGVGEQREIALEDGSSAMVDADTHMRINFTRAQRKIELVKGRALFDVAHDPSRPFVVASGSSRVEALGTRFQVQRREEILTVVLESGRVEVAGVAEGKSQKQILQPGEQLMFDQGSTARWKKTSVELTVATGWSQGRHIFREQPLSAVVEEINRYAKTKVRLGDPMLGDLNISGNFLLGDSSEIASALATILPVRVVKIGDELVIFPVYGVDAVQDVGKY